MEIKHAEDSYMTQIVYALQIEHLINQAKQGEREKLLKLLINKGLLCPKMRQLRLGAMSVKISGDNSRQKQTQ